MTINIDNCNNVEKASKPDGKFVEFEKCDRSDNDKKYQEWNFKEKGFILFSSNLLECKEITLNMRYEALNRLISYLNKAVDKKIDEKLKSKKRKLRIKYEKEFKMDVLNKTKCDLLYELSKQRHEVEF